VKEEIQTINLFCLCPFMKCEDAKLKNKMQIAK